MAYPANLATEAEKPICAALANAISDVIIKFTLDKDKDLGLDVAVCVVAAVAADYARKYIGVDYLEALADVVMDRANFPLPQPDPLPEGK